MNRKDTWLAILVTTIWGGNFVAIKLGLDGMPPMLLAALRYAFTALPAIFFFRKPAVEWRYTIAYGLTIGFGQFACLFYAMAIGMPAGLASIILQAQAFFTALFAAAILKEPIKARQMTGFLVAAVGLYFIGGVGKSTASSVPLFPLVLTLMAAAFWGISNIIVRAASHRTAARGEKLDMLSMVAWSSLVPPVPLLVLGAMMGTTGAMVTAIANFKLVALVSLCYLAYCGTIFGSSRWSSLLSKYPAGKVAPFSLVTPVAGLFLAMAVLGERLSAAQWLGSAIILLGLMICNFGIDPVRRLVGASTAD
jgi:O-acetylserine/cysteine efflux transporter